MDIGDKHVVETQGEEDDSRDDSMKAQSKVKFKRVSGKQEKIRLVLEQPGPHFEE